MSPKTILKSVLTIISGLIFVIVLTTTMDILLGIRNHFDATTISPFLVISLTYRLVIMVLSGVLVGWLSPNFSKLHGIVLGTIGTIIAIFNAVQMWDTVANWFLVAVAVLAIPSVYLGVWIYLKFKFKEFAMSTFTLDDNLHIFYVQADSYPKGIRSAFLKLYAKIDFGKERRYFGISRPEKGSGIVYRAGAEQLRPDEHKLLNLPSLELKAGEYYEIVVRDFRKDLGVLQRVFEKILHQPNVDPEGCCVEVYAEDPRSVQCLVRKKDANRTK